MDPVVTGSPHVSPGSHCLVYEFGGKEMNFTASYHAVNTEKSYPHLESTHFILMKGE